MLATPADQENLIWTRLAENSPGRQSWVDVTRTSLVPLGTTLKSCAPVFSLPSGTQCRVLTQFLKPVVFTLFSARLESRSRIQSPVLCRLEILSAFGKMLRKNSGPRV